MVPQKHFYMIRHGQTESNLAHTFAGQLDTPLTAQGRAEAAAAVDIVDALPVRPTAIFHSNLSRARDTATILNQNLKLPLHENKNLSEQDFGDWVGKPTVKNVEKGVNPPGGETFLDFWRRVEIGLTEILSSNIPPVLISTHGGVMEAFHIIHDAKPHVIKNCQLYEYLPSTEGKWQIFHYGRVDGEIVRLLVETK